MENTGKNAKQIIQAEIQAMYASFHSSEFTSLGIGMNHWMRLDCMLIMTRKIIETHQPGTGQHTFYQAVERKILEYRDFPSKFQTEIL